MDSVDSGAVPDVVGDVPPVPAPVLVPLAPGTPEPVPEPTAPDTVAGFVPVWVDGGIGATPLPVDVPMAALKLLLELVVTGGAW